MKTSKALNKSQLKQFIGIMQALVDNVSPDISRTSLINVEAVFVEGALRLGASDGHKMIQVQFDRDFFENSECKSGSIRVDDLKMKIAELKLIKLAKEETRVVELPAIDPQGHFGLIDRTLTKAVYNVNQEGGYSTVDAILLGEVCQSLQKAAGGKQVKTKMLTAAEKGNPIGFEVAKIDNELNATIKALLAPMR